MQQRTTTHMSSFITKSYLSKQFRWVPSALTVFKTTPHFPWKKKDHAWLLKTLDFDDFKSAYNLQQDLNGNIKDYEKCVLYILCLLSPDTSPTEEIEIFAWKWKCVSK